MTTLSLANFIILRFMTLNLNNQALHRYEIHHKTEKKIYFSYLFFDFSRFFLSLGFCGLTTYCVLSSFAFL